MSPTDFRARLEALCWSQRGFAALLGVPHNTVHRWAVGQAVIPAATALWLEAVSAWLLAHPPPRSGLPRHEPFHRDGEFAEAAEQRQCDGGFGSGD